MNMDLIRILQIKNEFSGIRSYIWVCFIAFLTIALLTIATVTLQSYRVATANPASKLNR